MRFSVALFCALLAFSPDGEANAVRFRAFENASTRVGTRTRTLLKKVSIPNDFCLAAHVLELEVQEGIRSVPVNADYCELAEKRVPREVVALLARVGEINARYARAFGRAAEDLFGTGVRLTLAMDETGPLASATSRMGDGFDTVEIDVFKDFRADRFPESTYAHELTHWLLIQGLLGEAARDLEPSYLFIESFPDLVASYVTNSFRIGFKDPTVRKELTFAREGAPLKSMNRPFREFYLGRFQRDELTICAGIPAKSMTANERGLCHSLRTDGVKAEARRTLFAGAKERPPTESELAAPFSPERCLIHYKNGTVGLNACYRYALGPVLISFVHSFDSVLGAFPLVRILAAIDEAGKVADRYECAFTSEAARERETKRSFTDFSSVMRVMKTIRDGLGFTERAVFDRIWAAHGLDRWAKLERFDRETVIAPFAYQVLARQNPAFVKEFRCASEIPSQRGPKCAAKCEYTAAEAAAAPEGAGTPR